MAAYIKTLKDASRENTIYPITRTEAVYREDNATSVEDALVTLESEVAGVLENINGLSEIYETKNNASSKLDEAKAYIDEQIAAIPTPDVSGQIAVHNTDSNSHADIRQAIETAKTDVKNDLLNGAGEAYDTLKELGELIDENTDAIGALEIIAINKADKNDIKQSDWNENDSTSMAYIQNRTHYDYSGSVFTQEINLSYLDNMRTTVTSLYGSLEGDMNFSLVEGSSYNVTIEIEGVDTFTSKNNVCFNYDDNGSLAIGDPSLFQHGTSLLIIDGIQRFVYGQINGNYILRLSEVGVLNQDSVTAKITIEENAFLKTLDEKFIPDTIARTTYVDEQLSTKSDSNHEHNDLYYTETEVNNLLNGKVNTSELDNYYTKPEVEVFHDEIKDYVDDEVAALVNSAPETLDTLGELAEAFQENKEVVDVLNEAIATKYSSSNPPPYPVTSVQGKTGAVNFTTETWTFTLSNGSTVTKKVLLG